MHKVGIIGLGFIGKMHLGSLRRTGMAAVVAVADKNPANLGKGAVQEGNSALGGDLSLDGVKTYSGGDELLADPDVEIVLIGLPTNLHKEYSLKAIKAGKHVMCEKPFVRHAKEGKEILEALKGYDKNFMVLQCIRFWPAYAKAYELIESGEYGKVLSAHFVRNSPKPTWSWDNWLLDNPRGGGALVDLHIHDVDFVNYCFGKPAKLEAAGLTPSPPADRHTLLRRASFDVTGLPPLASDVESLAGDPSTAAFEQHVQRLLSSAHFGERWARHWLDQARYADSDGYEKDNARPDAWRWRDWVIEAIGRDVPFDRFTVEQLSLIHI